MPANAGQLQRDARGTETRRRLVRAGLQLFGTRDFDNVTTRQLAEAAEVNLGAIPYHFGSKERLYLAVAGYILDSIGDATFAAMDALGAAADDTCAHPATLLQRLRAFMFTFGFEVVGTRDSALRAGFILREQLRPGPAFDILYQGFMRDVHDVLTRAHARLLRQNPDNPEMLFRAHALIGQILGFRLAHEVLRRRLGRRHVEVEAIIEFIAEQNIHALEREIAAAG